MGKEREEKMEENGRRKYCKIRSRKKKERQEGRNEEKGHGNAKIRSVSQAEIHRAVCRRLVHSSCIVNCRAS